MTTNRDQTAPREISISAKGSLQLRWDGKAALLAAELLRTHSPSAEVRGHDGVQRLVTGKSEVRVTDVELIGYYGIKLTFSDGHDSGIFTWEYLKQLHRSSKSLMQDYRKRADQ